MRRSGGLYDGMRAGVMVTDDGEPCFVYVAERPCILKRGAGRLATDRGAVVPK